MKCFYINLDKATARREAIEESFSRHKQPGWTLTRIAAVDAARVREDAAPGSLRDEEKACLLSHKKVIEANRDGDEHVLVLEDDAIFGPSTFAVLERLLERASSGPAWDLIYTDVAILQVSCMAGLLALRQEMTAPGAMMLLDLAQFRFLNRTLFAGSTAYVVNGATKSKLYDQLDALMKLDVPYDLLLREEIYAGRLKAFVTFPFLTSVSPLSDHSSIQGANPSTERAWNSYRRMIWRDGDWQTERRAIADLSRTVNPEAKLYGELWACMVNSRFREK